LPKSDFNLLVDAGGFSRGSDPTSVLQNEYLIKGLAWLNYSAFNLGYRELNNKPSVLKKLELDNHIDFLSANILLKGTGKTAFKPYVIKELISQARYKDLPFKKIKIAIVGLCDEDLAQLRLNQPNEPVLEYIDPLQTAKTVIPEVRKKADMVILLYYGKYEKMKSVATAVPGIDIVVLGGETYLVGRDPKEVLPFITVTSQAMGKYAAVLSLNLDKYKKIVQHSMRQAALDENIKDDEKFSRLAKDFEAASQNPSSH